MPFRFRDNTKTGFRFYDENQASLTTVAQTLFRNVLTGGALKTAFPAGDEPDPSPGTLAIPTNIALVPDDSEILIHWEADFANHDSYEVRIDGSTTVTGIKGGAYLHTGLTNSQSYSFEVRARTAINTSPWSSSISVSAGKIEPTGTEYFVDPVSGNDSNNGLATGTAWNTINHALAQISAGDGIRLMAGTYQELGQATGGKHNIGVSFVPHVSGTTTDRIVIQPAPGAEGSVILDGESTKYGFFMTDSSSNSISSYVFRGIQFQNMRSAAIGHWDRTDPATTLENTSHDVIVEDCTFDGVRANDGQNVSHVAFWGTYDWVIRNNRFDDASEDTAGRGNGVQTYQTQRAAIYKNTFLQNMENGILFKDYWVKASRVAYHMGDIFFNYCVGMTNGVLIQPRGAGTPEANYISVTNNICNGAKIDYAMAAAFQRGRECRVFNNSLYNAGIEMDGCESFRMGGNLTPGSSNDLDLVLFSGNNPGLMVESDYNIFDTSLSINFDRFNASSGNYTSLAALQALTSASHTMLGFDNPDPNSIQSDAATLFENAGAADFTNRSGSPAIGFMPDGSNAGAYQVGSETIGYTP